MSLASGDADGKCITNLNPGVNQAQTHLGSLNMLMVEWEIYEADVYVVVVFLIENGLGRHLQSFKFKYWPKIYIYEKSLNLDYNNIKYNWSSNLLLDCTSTVLYV